MNGSITELVPENEISNVDFVLDYSDYKEKKEVVGKSGQVEKVLYYHHIPIMNGKYKLKDIYVGDNKEPEELIFRERLEEVNEWTEQHLYTMVMSHSKPLKLIYS